MANGKNTLPWLMGVVAAALIIFSIYSQKPAVPPQPITPTQGVQITREVSSVDLLLTTKDPVAYKANNELIQPLVEVKYWREGATAPTVINVSATPAIITVNPGENIRVLFSQATGTKVYMDETSITAPADVRTKNIELPTKIVGAVELSHKWDGSGGTTYTLQPGELKDKSEIEIKESIQNRAFKHPVIALAYDNQVFDYIKVKDKATNQYLNDYKIPERLRLATAGGEYYQKFYDTGIDELANFATKNIVLEMKALGAANMSQGCNVTITILDKAKYLTKDGKTTDEDVETSKLDTKTEIDASAD